MSSQALNNFTAKVQAMLAAMIDLQDAFFNLTEEEIGQVSEQNPLEKSFDDLVVRVRDWKESLENKR